MRIFYLGTAFAGFGKIFVRNHLSGVVLKQVASIANLRLGI
jgi:hypothetical protein